MTFGLIRKLYNIFAPKPLKRFKVVDTNMNVFTQKRNPITGATEWDMQHEDYDYHQEIARSAFADMLHDKERNKKYHKALELAIQKMHDAGKQAHVLDIGTGTGLLSIMAARAGADSVVACEAFKPMAECCLKILRHNGVDDKIVVIPKRSTELTVGENGDMKQKANILVTEVFDTELIGEGALSTFSHAHKNLLEEDCIVVPDSAVIYAQVVECPTMWKWNKLQDFKDELMKIDLRAPQKMKDCAGSAAVHDLQLSQLSRRTFKEISDQIPVFRYDWSGKIPLVFKQTARHNFKASTSGSAQMVFMWWELNMDTEGRIVLSCAPWWSHPAASVQTEYPQDTIPWRDHWMQAIYYLPQPIPVQYSEEYTLVSCQDEYSLWFFLEDAKNKVTDLERPICECGVHMAWSRTHVAYLNNEERIKMLLTEVKKQMKEFFNPVVLDLNGSSLLGLLVSQIGAKEVYILEENHFNLKILEDYIKENKITNVKLISDLNSDLMRNVHIVTCDPSFSSSIMPWENLKMAHYLFKVKDCFRHDMVMLPDKCELYVMPVEFLDLHKIRIPLGKCEGIDMKMFDELVELLIKLLRRFYATALKAAEMPNFPCPTQRSRAISDSEIESQPLWEYPCYCRGKVRKLLDIDLFDLQATYATNESHKLASIEDGDQIVNGFAVWTEWTIGERRYSAGPAQAPRAGDRVTWDPHTRQGVKILKNTFVMKSTDRWSFQVACDLPKGHFNMSLSLVNTTFKAVSRSRNSSAYFNKTPLRARD